MLGTGAHFALHYSACMHSRSRAAVRADIPHIRPAALPGPAARLVACSRPHSARLPQIRCLCCAVLTPAIAAATCCLRRSAGRTDPSLGTRGLCARRCRDSATRSGARSSPRVQRRLQAERGSASVKPGSRAAPRAPLGAAAGARRPQLLAQQLPARQAQPAAVLCGQRKPCCGVQRARGLIVRVHVQPQAVLPPQRRCAAQRLRSGRQRER
jgi:hypothetical protein